jgi:hypothetical protein
VVSMGKTLPSMFLCPNMSHTIGDDQQRTEHVSTNLLLTMLPKICVLEAKPNDRHLTSRPSSEK